MEIPVVSQTNVHTHVEVEYPVVIKVTQTNDTALVSRTENNEVETRLTAVALDAFSVMEAAASEMAVIQATLEDSQTELHDKLLENGILSQQLVAALKDEQEMDITQRREAEILKNKVAFLQKQMEMQAVEQQAELQRLQNLLTTTQKQETEALQAAQTTWEQQKAQLIPQNNVLQERVNVLLRERNAFEAQISHSRRECDSLQGRIKPLSKDCDYFQNRAASEPQCQKERQAPIEYKLAEAKRQADRARDEADRSILPSGERGNGKLYVCYHKGTFRNISWRLSDIRWPA